MCFQNLNANYGASYSFFINFSINARSIYLFNTKIMSQYRTCS